jgi:hypothetical protein
MYLNRGRLAAPGIGWKWILECTPKPTDPYPKAVQVAEAITCYQDITDFLKQFPPIQDANRNLEFFGITNEWVEKHKPQLFGFLLAFLVGDGGKSYAEYETRSRHYAKTAMTTNMSMKQSNFRVLRYVQLAFECIGIESHQIEANQMPNGYEVIRWNSVASNLITWIVRVCLGLKEGERTSRNPVNMSWLFDCPREFTTAFLQGIEDSDGYVHNRRPYTEISSIPNAKFYAKLVEELGYKAKTYPGTGNPTKVRIDFATALRIPLFNPVVRSYRHDQLIERATQR